MTYSQRKTRKRRGTAAMLAAFRLGDTLSIGVEAAALRGYCQGILPADEYTALVAEAEAKYLPPWDRVKFWSDALERTHAVLQT